MKQQFLKLIDRKIELLSHKNNSTFWKSTLYECIIWFCKELRQETEKMEDTTLKTIDEMIEDELNPEWTTINESRLRCLEDVIWRIKWEPPSRHNIT